MQGHPEYDRLTLSNEYFRDVNKGINPEKPVNYFENDDETRKPILTWRGFSNTLYANWLNIYVYQNTPYVLKED